MKRFGLLLLGCLAVSSSAVLAKPKPGPQIGGIHSGIYSSVSESEQTGDRGGVEFRLYAEAARPYVDAVLCESECNGGERYYVRPTADGFRFTWKNPRRPSDDPVTFRVWKVKRTVWIQGENNSWMKEKLSLLKEPFGLLGVYDWALAPGCRITPDGEKTCGD
ncbi:hypothetical protein ACFOWX_05615 [Sphingorhabdus arenilitoris]|uniref:Uncharacterized protein n=1 Tax=Sphingorhabdus arenilitoris TaxID=1490041 RepID=A0ABV8RGQ7_9SPHN